MFLMCNKSKEILFLGIFLKGLTFFLVKIVKCMRLQLATTVVILMTFVMLQCNQKKTLRERKRVRNKSFNVVAMADATSCRGLLAWQPRQLVLHLEKSSFFLKASYRDKNCYLIDKQSHK